MTLLVTRPREQYPANALADVDDARGRLRAASWLAQLAYEDDAAKVDDIAADWSLQRRFSIAPHAVATPWVAETRLHVLEGRNLTIVTFCGTDPLRFANWITDLRIAQIDAVHSGFADALDAAWPQLVPFLSGARGRLWFVGHSLGAALAVLGALRAKQALHLDADAVIGFGMPRIGGPAFASLYEGLLGARTLRAVHGEDIVARMPPPEIGYRHVGRRLSCARGETFDPAHVAAIVDDEPYLPSVLSNAAAALLAAMTSGPVTESLRNDPIGLGSALLPPIIADHLPDRYCTACE